MSKELSASEPSVPSAAAREAREEVGLYVHIPFCAKKCYYCDFNSYTLDRAMVERFLHALEQEVSQYSRKLERRGESVVFDTLFIGGGTPTCLAAKELRRLLEMLRAHFTFRADAEVSCEANPGSSNVDKYGALREAGVNRISIGVQSLDDGLLQRIGRVHSAQEALESFDAARRAGFENINLDLMFALPGQTQEQWQQTLQRIIQLESEHLSCYSLIVEEQTPFGDAYAAGRLTLPSEDDELTMYEWAIASLRAAGYDHYEISNFARPGRRSRHNTIYWRIQPYLGLGPGAHGYWDGVRYSNERLPHRYAEALAAGRLPIVETRRVDKDEAMDDTMIFGLRMLAGVDRAAFRSRFGVDVAEVYARELRNLQELGLLEVDEESVRLSARGLPMGNRVFEAFLRLP